MPAIKVEMQFDNWMYKGYFHYCYMFKKTISIWFCKSWSRLLFRTTFTFNNLWIAKKHPSQTRYVTKSNEFMFCRFCDYEFSLHHALLYSRSYVITTGLLFYTFGVINWKKIIFWRKNSWIFTKCQWIKLLNSWNGDLLYVTLFPLINQVLRSAW